jgi:hypothetical protein
MSYGKKIEKNRAGYMIGCFVATLAITYLIFNIIDGWRKYQESTKRLEASISAIAELEQQYTEVKKVKSLEESSTGYEMHVRSKFDLNKPDENAVLIIAEESLPAPEEEKGIKKMMHKFRDFFN